MNYLITLLQDTDPTSENWTRIPICDAEELEIDEIELWEEDGFVRTSVHYPQPLRPELQ